MILTLVLALSGCAPEPTPAALKSCETSGGTDLDLDGYLSCASAGALADCDDSDPTVYPGAWEQCDGLDGDCDGEVPIQERDLDGDGALACDGDCDDADETLNTRDQDADGFTTCDDDCDDHDDARHPARNEACNGADDDCDGTVPLQELDDDGDGQATCAGDCDDTDPAVENLDRDGDGEGTCGARDCDDYDPARNARVVEACNGTDDDCDGAVDEEAIDSNTFWLDADADGFGGADLSAAACDTPAGYADNADDCDDLDPEVHPTQAEECNGHDDDCDGTVDEAWPTFPWYADIDGDGFGDPAAQVDLCYQPEGYIADATDCDDTLAAVHPGADEYCNGYDDDCDGTVDEDDAVDAPTWYADADADTYGDPGVVTAACSVPGGYADDPDDCDDADAAVHPGADEHCDGIDEDCDREIDEGAIDGPDWYADTDGDAYGDPGDVTTACSAPAGTVADDTDCDDDDDDVHPGAVEQCNGIDDDCDGLVDDGATGWCDDVPVTDADFYAYGDSAGDYAGAALWTAGDFDADGYDDIVVGQNAFAFAGLRDWDGGAYVVFGPRTAGSVSLGSADVVLLPEDSGDQAGFDVRDAGDEDGDGTDDVLVGAPGNDDGGSDAGAAYLVHGGVTGSVDLGTVVEFRGASEGDAFGTNVASVDADCDGTRDMLLAGVSTDETSGLTTASNVALFQGGGLSGTNDAGSADVNWSASSSENATGFWVGNLGDLDSDGCDDVGITDARWPTNTASNGIVYVLHGGSAFMGSRGGSVYADAEVGYEGASGDYVGYVANGTGDVTGDGIDDMAIGAPSASTGGAVYVVPGSSGRASGLLSVASSGYELLADSANDEAGAGAAIVGDANGDGTDDLLVGAPSESPVSGGAGAAYLLYGPITGDMNLRDSSVTFYGTSVGDYVGFAVGPAGDTDADGNADLLIGGPGAGSSGHVYLFLGR